MLDIGTVSYAINGSFSRLPHESVTREARNEAVSVDTRAARKFSKIL